jgi:hypothetical protein
MRLGWLHVLTRGKPILAHPLNKRRHSSSIRQERLNIISVLSRCELSRGYINSHPALPQVSQQGLSCKQIQQGSEGTTLAHPSTAQAKWASKTIHNSTTVRASVQHPHPGNKLTAHPQSASSLKQKLPGESIICFTKINKCCQRSAVLSTEQGGQ